MKSESCHPLGQRAARPLRSYAPAIASTLAPIPPPPLPVERPVLPQLGCPPLMENLSKLDHSRRSSKPLFLQSSSVSRSLCFDSSFQEHSTQFINRHSRIQPPISSARHQRQRSLDLTLQQCHHLIPSFPPSPPPPPVPPSPPHLSQLGSVGEPVPTKTRYNHSIRPVTELPASCPMGSIYQLVSNRVKGSTPSTPACPGLNMSSKSTLNRYPPSFTESECDSRSARSDRFNTSILSLSGTSFSSQSTFPSSIGSDDRTSEKNIDSTRPSSLLSNPRLSLRSTSASTINKSIQNLLRRRKTKPANSGLAQPSVSSLKINTTVASEFLQASSNLPQLMPRSAIVHSTSDQAQTPDPLAFEKLSASNTDLCPARRVSLPNSTISKTSLKSMRLVSSERHPGNTHPSPYLPVSQAASETCPSTSNPLIHELFPTSPEVVVFGGSLIMSDSASIPMASLQPLLSSRHPPRTDSKPAVNEAPASDGEDSEMEDIITNLRNIAAPKLIGGRAAHSDSCSIDQGSSSNSWDPCPVGSSLDKYSSEDDQEADHDNDDSNSEILSESSFDAEASDDETSNHFPLPSWPKLDSTSQSPFDRESLASPHYRPSECSISISLNGNPHRQFTTGRSTLKKSSHHRTQQLRLS